MIFAGVELVLDALLIEWGPEMGRPPYVSRLRSSILVRWFGWPWT